jgi:hypothetical protein
MRTDDATRLVASIQLAAARVRVRHHNPDLTIRMHPLDLEGLCREHGDSDPCWPRIREVLGYRVQADDAIARGHYLIEWEAHP